jgi:membrane protein required for colicin V production
MSTIDIGILGIILLSGLVGLVRGITREFFGLVSWTGAIVSSYLGFPYAGKISHMYIHTPMLADGAAYVGLFVCFLIIFSIISQVLSNIIRDSSLSGIDRSLGALFGMVRGLIIIIVVEISVGFLMARSQHPEQVHQSHLMPMIYRFSDATKQMLPEKAQAFIREKYKQDGEEGGKKTSKAADTTIESKPQSPQASELQAEDLAHLKPKTEAVEEVAPEASLQDAQDAKENLDKILEMGKEIEDAAAKHRGARLNH